MFLAIEAAARLDAAAVRGGNRTGTGRGFFERGCLFHGFPFLFLTSNNAYYRN